MQFTNTAWLELESGTGPDASTTVELCTDSPLSHTKTAVSANQLASGDWVVRYVIEVANTGLFDAVYDLSDTVEFGAGITPLSGLWFLDGTIIGGTWSGLPDDTTTVLATGRSIGGGDTHTYVVDVTADVAAGVIGSDPGTCSGAEGTDGGGFLNAATLTSGGTSTTVKDCAEPVYPDIDKAFESVTENTVDGGWDVTYTLNVSNPNETAVYYELSDLPQFANGVTIEGASVTNTAPGDIATNPGFDAENDFSIVESQQIAAGATHTYLVTITVDLSGATSASGTPGDRECVIDGDGAGHGLYNEATLGSGNDEYTDDACGPIPDPTIETDKTAVSAIQNSDGSWTVSYLVEATNTSTVGGAYNLTDTIEFGAGITPTSANWSLRDSDATGDWTNPVDTNRTATLAALRPLAGGATHTYVVTVQATVEAGVIGSEAGTCEIHGGSEGGGFLNSVKLTAHGETVTDEDCITPALPDFDKEFDSATPNADGTWNVTYTLTVDNSDNDSRAFYNLNDNPGFADGVTINGRTVTNTTNPANPVDVPWDGSNPILSGAEIDAGATHTYQVTFNVSVGTGIPAENLTCDPISGSGNGYFNAASITSGPDTIEGVDCGDISEQQLTIEKSIEASYTETFEWEIEKKEKSVSPVVDGEATISYDVIVTPDGSTLSQFHTSGSVTVTNPNGWNVDVTLTDVPAAGSGTCTLESTTVTVPAATATQPGSVTVPYDCTFAEGFEPTTDSVSNTATATWTDASGAQKSDSDTASADWDVTEVNRTIDVVDYFDGATNADHLGRATWNSEGTPTTFPYQGTVELPAGECVIVENTGRIKQTGQEDSVTTEICDERDLTVAKSIEASYTETFRWDIDKKVSKVSDVVDDKATIDYTVIVTEKAPAYSELAMSGSVVVTNPNSWAQTVTLTDTPAVGGATCTLESTTVTVPANGSATVDYDCTFAPGFKPSDKELTNTVTATWLNLDDAPRSASDTATVDWDVTEVNRKIDVDDYFNGSNKAERLGSITWSQEGKVTKYEFQKKVDVPAGECVVIDNLAKIKQTGQKDDVTTTICNYRDLVVDKTIDASYTETFKWDIKKKEIAVSDVENGKATIDYEIIVTPKAPTYSQLVAAGTITIDNPNSKDYVVSVVDDPSMGRGVTCTVANGTVTVPAGAKGFEIAYDCVFAPGYKPSDAEMSNTVTITWVEDGVTMSDSATAVVDWDVTEVNKTIDVVDYFDGDTRGDHLGRVTWNAEGTSTVFEYQKKVDVPAGECVVIDNLAKIKQTGQKDSVKTVICEGAPITVKKTVDASYGVTHDWSITKSVDPGSVELLDGKSASADYTVEVAYEGATIGGHELTGTITVVNPNDWERSFTVADSYPGAQCVVSGPNTVAANSSVTLTYECAFPAGYTHADGKDNVVTVNWKDLDGASQSNTGRAEVDWELDSELHRTVSVTDHWSGNNATLGVVGLDDDGDIFVTPATDLDVTAAIVNGKAVFTYTQDHGAPELGVCTTFRNTARITGDGGTVLDEDSASFEVCAEDDLVVAKNAAGSFTRTYDWAIEKTAVDKVDTVKAGEKATFDYTVTATPKGYTDSGYSLGGSVVVKNPNQYKDVEVRITDVVSDDAWTCSFASESVVVGAGKSVNLEYDCVLADGATPTLTGTNLVTVEWVADDGTVKSVQHEVAYKLTVNEVNRTVTVSDDLKGDNKPAIKLGRATWNPDGSPIVFRYSVVAWDYSVGTHTIENTACIVEVEICDDETVDYRVPPAPTPIPPTGANVLNTAALALAGGILGVGALMVADRRRKAREV